MSEIPRVHPETIEEVSEKADIIDVISEYVVLRKRGKDYVGLCPFHEEKTPSFTVSPNKKLYHCFGCNAGGNIFNFLKEINKQSFSEVVLNLAQKYQVPIKTVNPEKKQELQRQITLKEKLYEILALAANFYQYTLFQNQGKIALDYLKSERKLTETTIQQWQFGYAPPGWETLYRYLIEQKRYSIELVELAGLIKKRKSGNGHYDFFRNRLIIPIQDSVGRIIGFGSRSLGEELPKYLNSPENTLFNKSKILFAIHRAHKSITQEDEAIIVEGYFDAITLHDAGIHNVVASLGTALTQDQIKLLLRYTESKKITLNFDADNAGIQATHKAIKEIEPLIYSGQVQLKIINLPDGKDADEFFKSNPDAMETYQDLMENAPLWIDWQIDLLREKNLNQGDEFKLATQKIVQLLNKIQDREILPYYIAKSAEILSNGNSQYFKNVQESLYRQIRNKKPIQLLKKTKYDEKIITLNQERELLAKSESLILRIYIHSPENRKYIIELLEEKDLIFTIPYHRILWQKIIQLEQLEIINSNQLLLYLQNFGINLPEENNKINHLFNLNEYTEVDILCAHQLITKAIASMEIVKLEKYQRYCLEKWQSLNPETVDYYSQEFENTNKKIQELQKQRRDFIN